MDLDNPQTGPRGRTAIDFMNRIARATLPLAKTVDAHIETAFGEGADLPADFDERADIIETELKGSRAYRAQQLIGDWHARVHGQVAQDAFAEIEADLRPAMASAESGPATLELNPDIPPPDYWRDVSFHRSGAWDSSSDMGLVHGLFVHRDMVAALSGADLLTPRLGVCKLLQGRAYRRILEMGGGSGYFTRALATTFPDAEIHSIDLSRHMLEQAKRVANTHGWPWRLYQRNAEATGFAAESFDLVTSYILLHELPGDAVKRVFDEAFRVLQPGGDMLMSDVARFADMTPIDAWKTDRAARFGGEPHWRESASLDLARLARDAGFANVTASGRYPHIVRGKKPA